MTTPPPTSSNTATSSSSTTTPSTLAASAGQWITYHGDNARSGVAGPQPALAPIRVAWSSSLDGSAVYGQPLVAGGRVLVATEDDDVFALDPRTGATIWEVELGTPLRNVASAAAAGCGDIDPLGVTSTPVVDPGSGVLYVVGELSSGGAQPVHHELFGIDIATGRTVSQVDADPPLPSGENPVHLLQRAALAFADGRVYVAYGGQYGDCGLYHGWVVALPVGSGGAGLVASAFDATPDSTGGAVWQSGGGPSIDSAGNVFISTGNPNSGGSAPWSEAVVKLDSALDSPPEASFQDKAASGDLDLATGDVVLLPDGNAFAVGKTDIGYLLNQSGLGRVHAIIGTVCGSDPDGGAAYDNSTDSLYVPCRDGGITQIDLSVDKVGWQSGQVNSAPIIVNGNLWALSYPRGTLQELNPATGAVLQTIAVGRQVPNFASPSAALGLLLVGTKSGVVAFTGPAGPVG